MVNRKHLALPSLLAGLAMAVVVVRAQQPEHKHPSPMSDCPMHRQHMDEMNRRGDRGMGFSQAKTTHHFLLTSDGGAIRVEANDAQDKASRDQIRQHLAHIARVFADGDFDVPMFVHDEVPPGVHAMRRMKSAIRYQFEETGRGGQVRIRSSDAEAIAAVHEFLRFQIQEHQTGDALEVVKSRSGKHQRP